MGAGGRLRNVPFSAALFAFALAFRVWLIHVYPIIFGGDTVLRLVNRDRIFISHQLPLLPALLHYLALVSSDATLARWLMASIGALACTGFYLLARDLMDARAAAGAALLFATHPFLVAISTVPFQEILMLATLFFAFHCFFARQMVGASLWLALACMTRFESWAACPVLAVAWALEAQRARRAPPIEGRNKSHRASFCACSLGVHKPAAAAPNESGTRRTWPWWLRGLLQGALLFGWAPIAWIVFRHGLAPAGSFVLETNVSAQRFLRYAYLGWIVLKNTPVPALMLAALGLGLMVRERLWKHPRVAVVGAFFTLFLLAIPFSAHGLVESPERVVTSREACLPIAAVLLAAGFGLTFRATAVRKGLWLLAAAAFLLGLWGSCRYLARENAPPDLRLSYRLARYLDKAVGARERAVVLAKPMERAGIQFYVDSAQRVGGSAAREAALRELQATDTSSFDYQRTLAYSHLGRERLLALSRSDLSAQPVWTGPPPEWIALWSDFRPSNDAENRVLEETEHWRPAETLREGRMSVLIFRRPST